MIMSCFFCVIYFYTENPEEDMFEKSVEIDGKMSNLKIIDSPAYGTVGIEELKSAVPNQINDNYGSQCVATNNNKRAYGTQNTYFSCLWPFAVFFPKITCTTKLLYQKMIFVQNC